MLSTFLSQLQSYFSKYFVIGSFSPMLAFAFINGGLAYFVFDPWRVWVDDNLLGASITGGVFLTTSFVVGVVLLAYALSALSTFLRQQLEGKWWGAFGGLFVPAQNRRRLVLVNARNAAYREFADLKGSESWEDNLLVARDEGTKKYPGKACVVSSADREEAKLRALEAQRQNNGMVKAADLKKIADALVERLKNCDADASGSEGVEKQHRLLLELIDYAKGAYESEENRARHARLQNELNSNFGGQDVAPTRMGNIANTIQSYAMRRYRCNLELVWSNLLQVVQKDAKAQATLLEAKTQLDFLVACCWLSLISAAIWSFVFFGVVPSRVGFLLAALAGPFIAYLWYRAAAEQYRSFADVGMTMFDTFRFDLLRAMQLRVPVDVEDERYIWGTFDRLVTFGQEGNFRYVTSGQADKPSSGGAPEPSPEPAPESEPAPETESGAPAEGKDKPKTKK